MGIVALENAQANWTKRIPCNSVQPSYNKNNNYKPDRSGVVARATEDTFENPKYNIQGWQLLSDVSYSAGDGIITVQDIIDLHTSTDTELYLIVKYGDSTLPGGEKTLQSAQSAYTDKIPVVIDQVQLTISANDSDKGYAPTGQITFTEARGANTSP